MEIFNIRISPLILVIFITYLNTVLSRHHIRHYRDRFKRQQGANLFLPDSYVTDTDEPDEGVWSEWSPPSACSRTCGGGVSTQNRQCEPGYTCRGPKFRYISCNTQDCPDLSDFRAQQCSEYDKVPFEGVYYQWVPYTKAPNQCELNCMPLGERFYYRHKQQVADGTRCNDQSPDVCVQGVCRHVGCDMMLGSPMREDKCRKCGGDGSTCQTINGRYDKQDLQVGYNNIILIPRGATNINVQETEPSNNYLAVRNTSGHYYLNGNWRIDFPRTKEFAGCAWKYDRFPQGFSAPDKISALGPTDEPLIIVLLYQDRNVGVDYEYSVPTLVSPGNDSEIYAWTFDPFNPCSVTCGGGLQYRNVTCVGRQNLNPVEESLCDSNTKPAEVQECNLQPCQAHWVPYPWGKCSAPCGGRGAQLREITCQQLNHGVSTIVSDDQCANLPKPPESKPCSRSAICPKWHTGPWKPCDHLCGDGVQTRKVKCFTKNGTRVEILDDAACTDPKPESQKACNLRPCEGVDWIATEWSGCENKCGLSNETRKVHCASINGKIYPDKLCEPELKPEAVRKCKKTNASCEYLFYASQWSECSAKCGQGIQTRTMFCGVTDGKIVTKVDDSKCDQTKKYETIKNCTVEEKCGGEWFSGPWKECSKKCGGGVRTRKVVCLLDNEVVGPSECDMASIMFAQEDCNTHSCVEGEEITTSMDMLSTLSDLSTTESAESSSITSETTESIMSSSMETTEMFTTESSPTESSEATSEFSTVPTETPDDNTGSTMESTRSPRKLDDDDYEIVQSDTCDDGEWVDADTLEPLMMGDDPYILPVPEKVLPEDPSPEDEELMLGDQAETESPLDAPPMLNLEGSGDDELSSSSSSSISTSDIFEGSGFSSTTDMSSTTTDNTEGTVTTPKKDGTAEPEVGESDLGSEPETTQSGITTEANSVSEETGSTKLSGTTTEFTGTTEAGATESSENTISTLESEGSTEFTGSTESPGSTTEYTGSTESTTLYSGNTEMTMEYTGSTESTTEYTGSTESTTEYTGSTESTTEYTGSTESTTEYTGSTESITEYTGSTESNTEYTGSTESTTEYTGSTFTDMWSTTEGTSSITDIFTEKPKMCKRKKKKLCVKTKHGCCPDKITPAKGPFDEGCPIPKTCEESKFGCCVDGVSPALGKNMEGCPQSHCNETLFGCCPDNTTPAEGNDNEGCPPPPPACTKSKYGCCADNITEAKGPKQKGCEKVTTPKPKEDCRKTSYGCCPDNVSIAKGEDFEGCDIFKPNCHESYFRCCPDGVTSAKGPNYKGCEMPCSNSTFGCCPDGRTPAHGRRGEGCCLAYEHGCCPDNITPARGPQLEGCSCEYSPYGCCPDNRTAAKGSDKEGCGCGYSEHGCCPDDFTTAKGPNYEGCPCHSFQFGCCPDGETTARGPNQQGCGCRNSEFGCCPDDITPAKNPDGAGCDCSTSRFGCCLDGVSEARGENYEGCEEIPLNVQENCILDKERGSCGNYTVKWFFDKDYGGCSRFWYGGCEGNGNRFKSKDECDAVCVKPEGKDRCKLPKISGPCEGYYVQWYYDADKKYCEQFVYSGCLGNNNRFETVDECNQLCATDSASDSCEQPMEEGPCRGNFQRWYYEKESKTCRQFRYGGCKGNGNNFATEAACMQRCIRPGVKKDFCDLPKVEGNCTSQEARWYSDPAERRCKPFYFTGCNGNNNNFVSEEACEAECPNRAKMDTCHLPAETGNCANYTDRYYYDTKDRACRHFYYGGCGGNENNFYTEQECQQRCIIGTLSEITPSPVTAPPTGPFLPEYCLAPSETGPCRAAMPRYFYDQADGVCKHFIYGGCHGNRNNFETIDDCYRYCGNAQDLCTLPPIVGDCKGEYPQYYYDQRTDTCKEFLYGGCGGNYNRFPDLLSCEQRCRRAPPVVPTEPPHQTDPVQHRPSEAICLEQPDPGNCSGSHPAYFFDYNSGRCTPFTYTGCGGNHNRFQSEEQCERLCGSFAGQDVCEEEKDPGPCNYNYPKYYFNQQLRRCLQFVYGGCGGNGNRFSSGRECESVCLTRSEIPSNDTDPAVCVLPVDKGTCDGGYNKRWYFDNERGECIAFIYSGCGGNFNNFKTFQSCITTCKDYLTQTEPPHGPNGNHPCQSQFEHCETLRCPYGIEAYVDENSCNDCRCHDPCRQVECPEGTKCAIDFNRNRTSNKDPNFVAVCRQTNKEGECPRLEQDETNCDRECYTDADCTLDLKCCRTGCGSVCTRPVVREPSPLVTQPVPGPTEMPYYPAQIDEQEFQPEVTGEIGSHITLRCAVRGNPTPHIAWSKDGLEIDGSKSRYRIKLDQSLQIITLHTTDSGIYLCTADNNLGDPVQNEIKLEVVEPSENKSASVLSEEVDPEVVVSFNAPAILNCFALGYPLPVTAWWKDDVMLPLKTSHYEQSQDHSLLIHSIELSDLGIYTCQAYNGIGKAASYGVTVKANGPYYGNIESKDEKYLKYIISPPSTPSTPRPIIPPTYIPPYVPTPYVPPPTVQPEPTSFPDRNYLPDDRTPSNYMVPIKVNLTTPEKRFPIGGDVQLNCEYQGYPPPQLSWYKDGVPLTSSNKINIEVHPTGSSRLVIFKATKADSGTYECEAINSYSRGTSSTAITVEGIYIHPSCTDNKFFANCALIVQSKYCNHKYYAKFCCKSCTEAGLLPVDGPHLQGLDKYSALRSNLV